MDTTSLLVVVVVLLAVVLVILYFFRRGSPATMPPEKTGETQPGASTFVFTPRDEIGGTFLVKRRVTIVAPDQMVDGQPRKLVVDALPLPADPTEPPPEGKGIDRLITSVIHPRVSYADKIDALYDFDPPLTITINYAKDDAEAEGKPNLSIVTFYPEGQVWRWQRLETDIDVAGMTCTAKLQTLTPKDPVGMGRP